MRALHLPFAAGLLLLCVAARWPRSGAPEGTPLDAIDVQELIWAPGGAGLAARVTFPALPGMVYGVALLDPDTGAVRHILDWPDVIAELRFSDDARLVAVWGLGKQAWVGIYDVATGAPLAQTRCSDRIEAVAFEGDAAALCAWDDHLFHRNGFGLGPRFTGVDRIDLGTGVRTRTDGSAAVPGVSDDDLDMPSTGIGDRWAFEARSPDGRFAAYKPPGGGPTTTFTVKRIGGVEEEIASVSWPATGGSFAARFRPDGLAVAVSQGAHVEILNLTDGLRSRAASFAGACRLGDCEDGFGRQEAAGGLTYVGRFRGGVREGVGFLMDAQGAIDSGGYWVNGHIVGSCAGDCLMGRGTLQTPNWTYTGDFSQGQRHGVGRIAYPDGSEYTGGWDRDQRHGVGVETKPGVDRYDGSFEAGQRSGQGRWVGANGATYTGAWREGRPHGHGVEVRGDGTRLEGPFVEGRLQGAGVQVLPDGTRFEGAFLQGERHGYGVETSPSGAVKKGDWSGGSYIGGCVSGDCVNGTGVYRYADGSRFEGSFRNGYKHGDGRTFDASGRLVREERFEGGASVGRCVAGNCIDGTGTFEMAAGGRYEGQFAQGAPHGQGTLTEASGTVAKGTFRDGMPNGQMNVRYADGGRYVGEVKGGKRHGPGELTRPDGRVLSGTFFNDAPFGTMTLAFPNGDVYKGAFPAGPGSLTYANGDVLEGQFIEGVANGPCRLFRVGGGGGIGDWQGGEQLPPGARYGQFATVAAAWEAYRKGYPE